MIAAVASSPPRSLRTGTPAFDAASGEMAWTDRTGPEVDRVAKILQPLGDERVLDMACGSGRHSLELRRRGLDRKSVV